MTQPVGSSYTPPPNRISSTDDLVAQAQQAQQQLPGYNPMANVNAGHVPSMKDLASLYYKSQGQGAVGDNPHPLATANKLAGIGFQDVKSADAVKNLLNARTQLAGGDRQAVFDQLAGQVNTRLDKQTQKAAGLNPTDTAALTGQTGNKAGDASLQTDVMQNWFDSYVSPYVQEQTAMLNAQADLFDDTVQQILPSMDPDKAQIMAAYYPLISAAYHQKAATFGNNFISGDDSTSLIGQLMQHSKRNASVLKFLQGQNGTSGGTGASFLNSLVSGQG